VSINTPVRTALIAVLDFFRHVFFWIGPDSYYHAMFFSIIGIPLVLSARDALSPKSRIVLEPLIIARAIPHDTLSDNRVHAGLIFVSEL